MMNEHTKTLLEECNSGCKMAIGSMNQVEEFIEDDRLRQVIRKYKQKHEKIESETTKLLEREGKNEKEPSAMATAFSWVTTEMKLKLKDDNHQIAKIMMDGCNMGIQTISKAVNQCTDTEEEARSAAMHLVSMEEEFVKELKPFL